MPIALLQNMLLCLSTAVVLLCPWHSKHNSRCTSAATARICPRKLQHAFPVTSGVRRWVREGSSACRNLVESPLPPHHRPGPARPLLRWKAALEGSRALRTATELSKVSPRTLLASFRAFCERTGHSDHPSGYKRWNQDTKQCIKYTKTFRTSYSKSLILHLTLACGSLTFLAMPILVADPRSLILDP